MIPAAPCRDPASRPPDVSGLPERKGLSRDGARRATCACRPARRGAAGAGTAEPRSESSGAARCGADNDAMIFTVHIQNISKYICAQYCDALRKHLSTPLYSCQIDEINPTPPPEPRTRAQPPARRVRPGGQPPGAHTTPRFEHDRQPGPASSRTPSEFTRLLQPPWTERQEADSRPTEAGSAREAAARQAKARLSPRRRPERAGAEVVRGEDFSVARNPSVSAPASAESRSPPAGAIADGFAAGQIRRASTSRPIPPDPWLQPGCVNAVARAPA